MKSISTLVFSLLLSFTVANAQLVVSTLSTKGISSTGVGAFINVGYPVNRGDMVTMEGGVTYFHEAVTAPLLLFGYRHTFNGAGTGLYAEPQLGYVIAVTSFPAADSTKLGSAVVNGDGLGLSGLATGINFGYIFPGKLALNMGVGYEHLFTTGGPAVNIFSLRFTHTIICGKKKYYCN